MKTNPLLTVALRLLVGVSMADVVHAQSSPDDAACQPPAAPKSGLSATMRVAPKDAPGEPLEIILRFRSTASGPLRDLLVYVYHTNASGMYAPTPGASGCLRFHGALHAWGRPDSNGVVSIRTIRPGAYPRSAEPAHVHIVVQFPGQRGFYLNDLLFDDDPRVTAAIRAAQTLPGGAGVVHPVKGADGVWRATREVVLRPPGRLSRTGNVTSSLHTLRACCHRGP